MGGPGGVVSAREGGRARWSGEVKCRVGGAVIAVA